MQFKAKLPLLVKVLLSSGLAVALVLFTLFDEHQNTSNEAVWYKKYKGMTHQQIMNLPRYDRPDLSALHNFEMTLDPKLGYPPRERLIAANAEKNRILAAIRTDGIGDDANWIERGPNNVAGRTRAFMFDPNDDSNKKVWAGGVSGGLWVNSDITNPASEWQNTDDFWNYITIGSMAYDPSDKKVFYVGTGEGWAGSSALKGAGILKSTDGGENWDLLNTTESFDFVQKLAVTSSGVVIATVRILGDDSGGGIFTSTDKGENWSQKVAGVGADIEIAANGDIYATTGIVGKAGKMYKSTDNGSNWDELSGIPADGERIEMAVAPSDAKIIYAVGTNGSDVKWMAKSIDSGASWSDIIIPKILNPDCTLGTKDFTRGQADYDLILAVAPKNPDVLIAGGIDVNRSQDGGTTWGDKGDGKSVSFWVRDECKPYVHADVHAITFRPGSDNEAIIGSDGGVSFSPNLGNSSEPTFSDRNKGYNVTQFYSIHPENVSGSNYYLGGTQDNGTQQYKVDGINSTFEVTGGDGGYAFVDADDPTIQITSTTFNNYFIPKDKGKTFNSFSELNDKGKFINPTDIDSRENKLYAAGANDEFVRYDGLGGTIVTKIVSSDLGGGQISHINVSEEFDHVIYVGTDQGSVYVIEDANTESPKVEKLSTSDMEANKYISSIALGDNDESILVTFSNYGVVSVWETRDGGESWASKEGNLPDMPIRWAVYNPANSKQALLATELGVWSSDDVSLETPTWEPATNNLANVRCDMLKVRSVDGLVVVGTYGRGVFTSDVFYSGAARAQFSVDNRVTFIGEEVSFEDLSNGASEKYSWKFGDTKTSTDRNPSHTYTAAGSYTVSLTVGDNANTLEKAGYVSVLANKTVDYGSEEGGDFESNKTDFVALNINGTGFELGKSTVAKKDGTASGDNAWVIGISASTYKDSTEAHLYSPLFDLSEAGSYLLQFKTKFDIEEGEDGFIVEYSLDKGGSWILLSDAGTSWYNAEVFMDNQVFIPGSKYFSGTTNGEFATKQANVSSLAGNKAVAFRFVFKSDASNSKAGLAIDDFSLSRSTETLKVDFTASAASVCVQEEVVYTSASSGNITSYEWNFGEGATPATATTQGPHTIKYSSDGAKTVKLTLNGSTTEEKTSFVTIKPLPEVEVTRNSETGELSSSVEAESYQWLMNGNPISGATSKTYEPTESGDFSVKVTVAGCEATSAALNVIIASLLGDLETRNLKVYPNPARESLFIEFENDEFGAGMISIIDKKGVKLISQKVNKTARSASFNLDLSDLPSGNYILELVLNEGRLTKRIVKR